MTQRFDKNNKCLNLREYVFKVLLFTANWLNPVNAYWDDEHLFWLEFDGLIGTLS